MNGIVQSLVFAIFQKQNLLLIAQGQREDGLLSLCFPAGTDVPIPFFSLVYLMQLTEYVQYSGDREILNTVAPVVHRIMSAFTNRIEENGLIAKLPYPYWNFYEWEQESNNEWEITRVVSIQQSPAILASGTSFVEDRFSTDQGRGGGRNGSGMI